DKIKNRIPRLLEHVKTALPLCDQVWALDNSSAIAASYGERTRWLVVPRRRRAVVLSESER
ncbi:MAG: hypothetical protein ABGX71_05490, partial [Methyloprofundus sp.]